MNDKASDGTQKRGTWKTQVQKKEQISQKEREVEGRLKLQIGHSGSDLRKSPLQVPNFFPKSYKYCVTDNYIDKITDKYVGRPTNEKLLKLE